MRGLAFRVVESRRFGDGRQTVVLLHGIGMSHRYHSRLHRSLSAEADVISLDLPGFGGLPKPADDLSVERMSAAIAALLLSLGAGPVVLVGHSMGAQWAVETAAQRPDLVAAVVAIGPVVDERHSTLFAQAVALAVDTLAESPRTNVIVFTDYLRCGPRWYLRQARHMLEYPLECRISDLRMPVLILRGEHDPVAGSAWCRLLRDRAPRSALREVSGGRHVVQRSAADIVAAEILRSASAAPRASDHLPRTRSRP